MMEQSERQPQETKHMAISERFTALQHIDDLDDAQCVELFSDILNALQHDLDGRHHE